MSLLALSLFLAVGVLGSGWVIWRALVEVRARMGGASAMQDLDSGPQATLIYDKNGKVAYSLFSEQRVDIALAQVSPHMVKAVIAAEDKRFYDHIGVDPIRIAGAAVANVKARAIVEGGSTITQQLARNLELGRQRTWGRKIREVILAAELEAGHDKDKILETYLNTAYFGDGYYGVEAASRGYFGKPAAALDVDEAAMLAGLIRAPSANSPSRNPDNAERVRNLVLAEMRDAGSIDQAELQHYVAKPLQVKPRKTNALAPHKHDASTACGLYYFEEVRQHLVQMFGEEQVLEGGLRVYTNYDPAAQLAAERSIAQRLKELNGNKGTLQGALVAMDPKSGTVVALVGGRDFHDSSYNRATQAHRQPGSAFKPFVWAAAVERGWAPGTVLTGLDQPIGDGTWTPNKDQGASDISLRNALVVSSNRAAAHLMQQVGMSSTIYTAKRLGIQSDLPAVPSLALGTGELTLLEMVSAYGAFANEGVWTQPSLVSKVENRDGELIWTSPFDQRRALSTGAAYLMNSMMSDVVNRGTGWRARQAGFTLPAAGKTGTSDDYADAWFVGYTPNLVAGVWFGFDKRKTIAKAHASDIAVPAWGAFMRAATRGHKAAWYEMPSDIEKVEICLASGHRAGEMCRRSPGYARVMLMDGSTVDRPVKGGITTELFTLGSAPYGECPIHSGMYLDTSTSTLAEMPPLEPLDPSLTAPLTTPVSTPPAVGTTGTTGMTGTAGTTGTAIPLGSAVGTAGATGSAGTMPGSTTASPSTPPTSLGTVPQAAPAGTPGVPVRVPAGMKIERVAKPDGTIVTIIKKQ